MRSLEGYDWFLIVLDVVCVVGLIWSLWWAKRNNYPRIAKDAAVPIVLISIYTIVLLLYLFGVLYP